MEDKELKKALEALLFVAEKPLAPKELSEIMRINKELVKFNLEKLKLEYHQGARGIQIIESARGYQMTTIPEVASYVEKMKKSVNPNTLSPAALETLAIVAYKQPLTRSEIENIRGVKSEKSLNTLLEKGLIKEVGRKDSLGKPILYGTTILFLQYFGLKDLEQLPPLEEDKQLELEPIG